MDSSNSKAGVTTVPEPTAPASKKHSFLGGCFGCDIPDESDEPRASTPALAPRIWTPPLPPPPPRTTKRPRGWICCQCHKFNDGEKASSLPCEHCPSDLISAPHSPGDCNACSEYKVPRPPNGSRREDWFCHVCRMLHTREVLRCCV